MRALSLTPGDVRGLGTMMALLLALLAAPDARAEWDPNTQLFAGLGVQYRPSQQHRWGVRADLAHGWLLGDACRRNERDDCHRGSIWPLGALEGSVAWYGGRRVQIDALGAFGVVEAETAHYRWLPWTGVEGAAGVRLMVGDTEASPPLEILVAAAAARSLGAEVAVDQGGYRYVGATGLQLRLDARAGLWPGRPVAVPDFGMSGRVYLIGLLTLH
jgi:hypothetical protein